MSRRLSIVVRPVECCACGQHAFVALTQGYIALLDCDDIPKVSGVNWRTLISRGRNVYAARSYRKAPTLKQSFTTMHRFLVLDAGDKCIDHINQNGLDNRKANLRVCTDQENKRNGRSRKGSSSKFKGVSLHKNGRWQASIRADGRFIHLGLFDAEEDAARAYDAAARTHFGEFASLNFPEATC